MINHQSKRELHSHLVSTVLFQTVQEATGVGQPERHRLKVVSSFLTNKKEENCVVVVQT